MLQEQPDGGHMRRKRQHRQPRCHSLLHRAILSESIRHAGAREIQLHLALASLPHAFLVNLSHSPLVIVFHAITSEYVTFVIHYEERMRVTLQQQQARGLASACQEIVQEYLS